MLSKNSTQVQIKSQEFILQRSRIWEQYGDARQKKSELNSYATQFGDSSVSCLPNSLSGKGLPADEVAESVWRLKQESEKVEKEESLINSYTEEIEKTKNQFFTVIAIASVIVVILLFSLFK